MPPPAYSAPRERDPEDGRFPGARIDRRTGVPGEGGFRIGELVDFHNHVIPGVDDGARDLEEAVAAVGRLRAEGVGTVVATPHFPASHTERPERLLERLARIDGAFERLGEELDRRGQEVRLERGAEVRLDSAEPDLSDSRLRLAGTHFALVEFSAFRIPPYGAEQLAAVREAGWLPILAHPERYLGVAERLAVAERWREATFFQVNAGSLLGEYGPGARKAARAFLARGWVDYLSTDFHARGEPGLALARDLLLEAGGGEGSGNAGRGAEDRTEVPEGDSGERADDPQREPEEADLPAARLLTEVNPRRMLANREPLPVPALELERGVAERLRGWFR